jgi:hypothetical protein
MFRKSKGPSKLDEALDRVLDEMANETPDSEEYAKLLTQWERLMQFVPVEAPRRLSLDTVFTGVSYILGVVVIVGYERVHASGSQAWKNLPKLKNP